MSNAVHDDLGDIHLRQDRCTFLLLGVLIGKRCRSLSGWSRESGIGKVHDAPILSFCVEFIVSNLDTITEVSSQHHVAIIR